MSSGQPTFQFADTSARWNLLHYADFLFEWQEVAYLKDTVIDTQTYQSFHHSTSSAPLYLRQDSGKVYLHLLTATPFFIDTTFMIYDFSKGTGETVDLFYPQALGGQHVSFQVDAADSVLLGKMPKRMFVSTGTTNDI